MNNKVCVKHLSFKQILHSQLLEWSTFANRAAYSMFSEQYISEIKFTVLSFEDSVLKFNLVIKVKFIP